MHNVKKILQKCYNKKVNKIYTKVQKNSKKLP